MVAAGFLLIFLAKVFTRSQGRLIFFPIVKWNSLKAGLFYFQNNLKYLLILESKKQNLKRVFNTVLLIRACVYLTLMLLETPIHPSKTEQIDVFNLTLIRRNCSSC